MRSQQLRGQVTDKITSPVRKERPRRRRSRTNFPSVSQSASSALIPRSDSKAQLRRPEYKDQDSLDALRRAYAQADRAPRQLPPPAAAVSAAVARGGHGRPESEGRAIVRRDIQAIKTELQSERELRHQLQMQVVAMQHRLETVGSGVARFSEFSDRVREMDLYYRPKMVSMSADIAELKRPKTAVQEMSLQTQLLDRSIQDINTRLNRVASDARAARATGEALTAEGAPTGGEGTGTEGGLGQRLLIQQMAALEATVRGLAADNARLKKESKKHAKHAEVADKYLASMAANYEELTKQRVGDMTRELRGAVSKGQAIWESRQASADRELAALKDRAKKNEALSDRLQGQVGSLEGRLSSVAGVGRRLDGVEASLSTSVSGLRDAVVDLERKAAQIKTVQNAVVSIETEFRDKIAQLSALRQREHKQDAAAVQKLEAKLQASAKQTVEWRTQLIQKTRRLVKDVEKQLRVRADTNAKELRARLRELKSASDAARSNSKQISTLCESVKSMSDAARAQKDETKRSLDGLRRLVVTQSQLDDTVKALRSELAAEHKREDSVEARVAALEAENKMLKRRLDSKDVEACVALLVQQTVSAAETREQQKAREQLVPEENARDIVARVVRKAARVAEDRKLEAKTQKLEQNVKALEARLDEVDVQAASAKAGQADAVAAFVGDLVTRVEAQKEAEVRGDELTRVVRELRGEQKKIKIALGQTLREMSRMEVAGCMSDIMSRVVEDAAMRAQRRDQVERQGKTEEKLLEATKDVVVEKIKQAEEKRQAEIDQVVKEVSVGAYMESLVQHVVFESTVRQVQLKLNALNDSMLKQAALVRGGKIAELPDFKLNTLKKNKEVHDELTRAQVRSYLSDLVGLVEREHKHKEVHKDLNAISRTASLHLMSMFAPKKKKEASAGPSTKPAWRMGTAKAEPAKGGDAKVKPPADGKDLAAIATKLDATANYVARARIDIVRIDKEIKKLRYAQKTAGPTDATGQPVDTAQLKTLVEQCTLYQRKMEQRIDAIEKHAALVRQNSEI